MRYARVSALRKSKPGQGAAGYGSFPADYGSFLDIQAGCPLPLCRIQLIIRHKSLLGLNVLQRSVSKM
jgi:hypothetical protein